MNTIRGSVDTESPVKATNCSAEVSLSKTEMSIRLRDAVLPLRLLWRWIFFLRVHKISDKTRKVQHSGCHQICAAEGRAHVFSAASSCLYSDTRENCICVISIRVDLTVLRRPTQSTTCARSLWVCRLIFFPFFFYLKPPNYMFSPKLGGDAWVLMCGASSRDD